MAGKKSYLIILLMGILALAGCTSQEEEKRLPSAGSSETEHTELKQINDDSGVYENKYYKLTLDKGTLGITVEDKRTGFLYESVKQDDKSNASWQGFLNSGVSVEFYSQRATMPERVDVVKGNAAKTFTYYENGFDVVMEYPSYEFSMELEVRLDEDGVSASVNKDSIKEGETYKLAAIYLYPMFGSTLAAEKEGYMLVPEGAGALIDLKDNHGKYKTPYTKKIYGMNAGIDKFSVSEFYLPAVIEPEQITLPVFGMAYTGEQQGFLGIVEKGDYNAEILAYPNGVMTDYNWITAKFNYREVYTMQTAASSGVPAFEKLPYLRDISIRYKLVSGEQADYTGLAKTYRGYLIEQGDLVKREDRFQVKIDFFGADSKKWFLFNKLVPMTTVKQMSHMLGDLYESGVTGILPVYTGWQAKGISLNYGSGNFKPESRLGSRKELYSLAEELEQKNISLVLEQDLLLANPSRFYNTAKDTVKGINQMLVEKPANAEVFRSMYYLTPTRTYGLAERFADRYAGTPVDSIALTSISNTLFSYYSGGDIYTREYTAILYEEVMKRLEGFRLSLEHPNKYLLRYTEQYFDMPLSTSDYSYLSKEIPFLPIVIKGFIPYWAEYGNFQANETDFFLRMLEYGAYPSFLLTAESPNELRNTNSNYIYTSEYEVLKPAIQRSYEELKRVFGLVEGAGIEAHRYLAEKVVSVQYDNGTGIIVNYSDSDYQLDNITVPARSYKVIQ